MRSWLFALAVLGFSHAAVAGELEYLRGSDVSAYTVTQVAPPAANNPAQRSIAAATYGRLPPVVPPSPFAPPVVWNWTGLYVGAYAGLALSTANFADPFGASVFGDTVRSPGVSGGGQIGYNWQPLGAPWVFGVEADAGALSSDGTSTCFAASAQTINTTCRVRPQAAGTFTGRIGYAMGPADELHNIAPIGILPFRSATMIYGKAGLAFADDRIDMAINNALAGFAGPGITSNSANATLWGWAAGLGVEHALTPAWSLKVEYDYLGFGSRNIANLGSSRPIPQA